MIIIPTRVCNTDKCSYCWILKKDFNKIFFNENIDLLDFKKKIKLIAKKNNDYELRFFWWEPFLKFKIIKKIITSLQNEKQNYKFIINTNLSLIKNEYLDFLFQNNVKLIISCNWDIFSHFTTRKLEINKIIILYKNIKQIIEKKINYQINIVTTPEIVDRLNKNITFIHEKLWWEIFNLLPVNYNWWDKKSLTEFEKQLDIIEERIKNKKLKITFINKDVQNNVWLFNSEITIDSDWRVYPSMVILEYFFEKEKEKINISDFNKNIEDFSNDFIFYEKENNIIYEKYINKILNKKFESIIDNDVESSRIFSNFLKKI